MQEIRRIGLLSLAKIQAVLMAILGLFGIVGLILAKKSSFNAVVLILVPVSYAVIGFVAGAITALIYNIVARFIGGVKIELESKNEYEPDESEFTQTSEPL